MWPFKSEKKDLAPMDMRFEPAGPTWMQMPGTKINYEAAVGDPMLNSAVAAAVMWMARAFPEAPYEIWKEDGDADFTLDHNHPLAKLIKKPTPYHSGALLWMATVVDLLITGNAYWIKVSNSSGTPVQLWPVPSALIEPKGPTHVSSEFISHYEYRPSGMLKRLNVNEVVHMRHGINPHNIRKGQSPLAGLLREIFTDNEASNYTASLLRNYGMPSVVFSPKDNEFIDEETRAAIAETWNQKFGGDNVGRIMVASGPATVETIGFSPADMDLSRLRAIPEERVTAVLGIPAAVVGLGSGLEQTKVGATLREYREQAWENAIIPLQRLIAEQVHAQFTDDFALDRNSLKGMFDLRHVRVLQDDEDKLYQRVGQAVKEGWLKVNQAQKIVGLEPDDTQDGYLRNVVSIDLIRSGDDPELQSSQGRRRRLIEAQGGDPDEEMAAALESDYSELKEVSTE